MIALGSLTGIVCVVIAIWLAGWVICWLVMDGTASPADRMRHPHFGLILGWAWPFFVYAYVQYLMRR